MDEKRSKGQAEIHKKGLRETWKANPLDIIEVIVSAQRQMQKANEEEDWVLKGLVRNAMLQYRPNIKKESQRLQ